MEKKSLKLENKVVAEDGQKIKQKSQVMLKVYPFERLICRPIYYLLQLSTSSRNTPADNSQPCIIS